MLADGADVIDVGGASSRPRGSCTATARRGLRGRGESRACCRWSPRCGVSWARASRSTPRALRSPAPRSTPALPSSTTCRARPRTNCWTWSRRAARELRRHAHARHAARSARPTPYTRDVVADVADELRARRRARRAARHRARQAVDRSRARLRQDGAAVAGAAADGSTRWSALGLPLLCGPSRKGFIADVAPAARARDLRRASASRVRRRR